MIKDPWCVLGLPFDPVSVADVRGFIFDAVKNKAVKTLTTTNVNWLVLAHHDPLFRERLAFSDLNVMDGVPLFWCARFLGYPFPERVAGPAIAEDLIRHKGGTKIRAYLYGGIGSAAEKACARLNKLSVSGLIGAGYCNPGFGDLEAMSAEDKIRDIQQAAPDMIVLAIGAQKGMAWIEKNRIRFQVGIISHLGAVINMLAGTIKRAPRWLQPTGLEWVWRISQERKLWERYVNDGFVFLFILLTRLLPLKWHLTWQRHFEAERTEPEIALTETSDRVAVSIRGVCNRFGRRNVQEGFLHAASAGKNVTIDLRETVYFESSFLGNLFLLKKELKNAGKELLVEGANGRAKKLFELYGVSNAFAIK
jgi:N-acetylglucosaminyldiphosphoundecaprenol N-acetyl-beta-D-mannosaminyltransferase